MKRALAVLVAQSILCSQVALATNGAIILNDKTEVVSLVYSSSHNKALIGLMNEVGFVHFEECSTPALVEGQKMTLSGLSSCQKVDGSTFYADAGTVERINLSFKGKLSGYFVAEQRNQVEPKRYLGALPIEYAAIALASAFGTMALGNYSINKYNRYSATGNTLGKVGSGALAGVSILGFMASSLLFMWSVNEDPYQVEIVPLEKALPKIQEQMVRKGQMPAEAVLDDEAYPALYPAIKRAIGDSIKDSFSL